MDLINGYENISFQNHMSIINNANPGLKYPQGDPKSDFWGLKSPIFIQVKLFHYNLFGQCMLQTIITNDETTIATQKGVYIVKNRYLYM